MKKGKWKEYLILGIIWIVASTILIIVGYYVNNGKFPW